MKILVACEYSGTVRDAFLKKGHDAYSCDILPCDTRSSRHIQGDVLNHLYHGWDMIIAHPPCTYLSNSGVRHLHTDTSRWDKMRDGANFFKVFMDLPVKKVAIENPIIHKYAVEIIGRRQDQVIQPWMFGHPEQKATCLWLKGLPKLVQENNVKEEMMRLSFKERNRVWFLGGKDRAKLRSKTFEGIAKAMSNQWG
jgi:hypothetical protein